VFFFDGRMLKKNLEFDHGVINRGLDDTFMSSEI